MKASMVALYVCIVFLFFFSPAAAQEKSFWEDLGLYGGQINSVAVSPDNSARLYAGSWRGDGFFTSADSGLTWKAIPKFRGYSVTDISIDANNPSNIWVSFDQYIAFSPDRGESWGRFPFAHYENRFCNAVEADPHDPSGKTVYVGTGGAGDNDTAGALFKTTDGGKTWIKTGLAAAFDVLDVKINPLTQDEVWAASSSAGLLENEGKIYRSSDGGDSWEEWNSGLLPSGQQQPFGLIDELLIHPASPSIVFACGGYGVVRNPDTAGPAPAWLWSKFLADSVARALCIPPSEPDTLFAGFFDLSANTTWVAKSEDSGETWAKPAEAPDSFLSMSSDPFHAEIIYAGGGNRGVYKTADAARTWQACNNGITANAIFDTDIFPGNPSAILAATIAGVYISADAKAWKQINSGLCFTARFHPQAKDTLYAGFDLSIGKSLDAGSTWRYLNVSGLNEEHKVTSIAVSRTSPATVFAGVRFTSGQRGEIIKIIDTAADFSQAASESIFTAPVPVNAVALHPASSAIIFAGTGSFYAPVAPGGIYISSNGGKAWRRQDLPDAAVVNAIAISPANPLIMYAGCGASDTLYAGIYKTINGGLTWHRSDAGLPEHFSVTDIQVDSESSAIVYAALFKGANDDGKNLGGTYLSLDGGKYWTQTGFSDYTLYDINSSSPSSNNKIYKGASEKKGGRALPSGNIFAGTASGLYQCTTAGTGYVQGLITIADTNQLIDGAQVISPYSNARSVQGAYLLTLPAGIHSLQAAAPGYVQLPAPSVAISAGSIVEQNIVLQPVEQDNCSSCIVCSLVKGTASQQELQVLRSLRDRVLNKTAAGKKFVALYYELGMEIWKAIESNQRLRQQCMELLLKAIPVARAAVEKNTLSVPSYLLEEGGCFLNSVEQVSPPELKARIKHLQDEVNALRSHDSK